MASTKKTPSIEELKKKGLLQTGDDPYFVVEWVPSGITELDKIMGGGFPRRRITIITGEYSTGKSFILQELFKKSIEDGLTVAYIDTEQSYDPEWWTTVGIPLDKIMVSQPATGEDAEKVVLALVAANTDIIAIDSLAALVPEAEAQDGSSQYAQQARLISRIMKRLLNAKHNSVIVATNQLRDTIGPGPADNMPGGRAQGYLMSLLLRTRREGWILGDNSDKLGFYMKVICRKSKVGTPFKEVVLPFYFRGEIDRLVLLVDRAIEAKIIQQRGPWFSFKLGQDEEVQEQGKQAIIEYLQEHEDTRKHLEAAVGD